VSACLAETAGPDGPDEPLRGYCAELCTPPRAPSATCVDHCVATGEPGAYYDDQGDYHVYEDERTEAERAAHAAACEEQCATVPEVSRDAIEACARHCDPEAPPYCLRECDPDPYDECVYTPCD
jgi:hypothetical protein